MKTENRVCKKIMGIVGFFIIVISIGVVFAEVGSNPFDGYQLNASYNIQIWAVSDCQQVNNTGSSTYFVPTRTAAELNAFKAHLPTGVASTSCTNYPSRIALWGGKIAKHTNSSGVWVDDSDCSTSWPSNNLTYCSEWNYESYAAVNFNTEWIYNWKLGGCTGSYESPKVTLTCQLCTDIVSAPACYSKTPTCIWHSWGSGCTREFCNNYYTQSECQDAGCYWSGTWCYAGMYCTDIMFEDSCSTETTYYDGPCCWNTGGGYCDVGAC